MPDTLITLQEASSLLGVSTATLRNWDKKGRLKAVRHAVNKYRMYRLDDVLSLQSNYALFDVVPGTEKERGATPLTAAELRRLVNALHRALRDTDGNSSLIERFDELTKVLYCKTLDERRTTLGMSETVFTVTGDDCTVAARVRAFYADLVGERTELFPARFQRIHLSDASLAKLTRALATVVIGAQSAHLKGLAYEELIKNTFEKGENQQFFTPPPIVDFIVEMVRPELAGTVCDPACGTGGFLLQAAESQTTMASSARFSLLGFEVDERLAWAARMNLAMHEVQNFHISHLPGAGTLGPDVREQAGEIDLILTNPPFGSDFTQTAALQHLELGRNRTSRRRGVLFIERCLELVRPGGLIAIIIDDGVLNGASNQDTREYILRHAAPLAIISLPDTAFMPYATVKSSVLLLRKFGRGSVPSATFFGEAAEVGRKPNGDPLFRQNRTTRQLELDSDLPALLSLWQAGAGDTQANMGRVRAFWSQIDPASPRFVGDGLRLDLAYHDPARHEAAEALTQSRFPVVPLHALCDVRNQAVIPSQDLYDEQINYIGLANIEPQTGVCTPVSVDGASLKSAVKKFSPGDVLFARMRPELRKICAIPEYVDEGYTSSECLVLTPKKRESGEPVILPELLAQMLRSDLAYGQVVHLVMGIGRPRLNNAAVLGVKVPLPPQDEQGKLLELQKRAEAAAAALLDQSERARQEASVVLSRAREELLESVLKGIDAR